ncbi:hypothetical protein AB0O28_19015 [Microbispora sp. NPDC088329]|uniref:DUF7352 domain-containing protein n=1 Tax=Microbispora sp. NPDC088329 TaxID=3154869 RepID=UPI003449EAFC
MADQTKTVHRHEVPVDDQPHTIKLTSNPHAVAARRVGLGHVVEFWAEHHGDEWAIPRTFQVFATGQPIPDTAKWWGTTGRAAGLVWHLYELRGDR